MTAMANSNDATATDDEHTFGMGDLVELDHFGTATVVGLPDDRDDGMVRVRIDDPEIRRVTYLNRRPEDLRLVQSDAKGPVYVRFMVESGGFSRYVLSSAFLTRRGADEFAAGLPEEAGAEVLKAGEWIWSGKDLDRLD